MNPHEIARVILEGSRAINQSRQFSILIKVYPDVESVAEDIRKGIAKTTNREVVFDTLEPGIVRFGAVD